MGMGQIDIVHSGNGSMRFDDMVNGGLIIGLLCLLRDIRIRLVDLTTTYYYFAQCFHTQQPMSH